VSEWPVAELGDHVDMQVGFPFKSAKFLDQSKHAVRLLRGDNIGQGLLRWDGAKHWPKAEVEAVTSYHVDQGDVILAMDRPWIEAGLKFAYVRPSDMPCLLVQRVTRMRGTATLETDYLRHVIASPAFTGYIKSITTGVNVPHISGKDIKKFRFPLPPLETQRRIASILGVYDDLIEVNRRRIAVLEEMARGLFEEWFVRFRFPGHEAVPILDTQDGPLPEGWTWDRIGDVAAYVNRGIAPKYDDEAETLVIGQKCIRDQRLSLVLARKQSKNVPIEKVVQPGDVLINSTGTGTLGRVAQAEQVLPGLTVDSHVTIVRPNLPEDRDYLGLSLFAMQPVFEHLGAGSTNQTELARSAVQSQMLVWAPVDLRARFGLMVRPMRELAEQLAQQNSTLAASRDLLLPRLISGQLSVAEAERELEEAA